MLRVLVLAMMLCGFAAAFGAPLPYKLNEKLTYDITGIVKEMRIKGTLGSISIEIADIMKMNGRTVYHCIGRIKSTSLIQSVYEINDEMQAWFDAKTYQIYKITMKVNEGGSTNFVNQVFDPKASTVFHTDKGHPKGVEIRVPKGAFDAFSFFYFLRTQKQLKNGSFTIFGNTVARTFDLSFTDGTDQKIEALNKKNKIKTVSANETKNYGISILLAKDFDFIPVLMNSFSIEFQKKHFVIQGKLTGYSPGTAVDEKDVK